MAPRNTERQIVFFIAVGCAAAAVHWTTVVSLVRVWGWSPLVANVVGWLVAFLVSFCGHHLVTFRDHGAALLSAGLRFFAISAGGFALNETAYALLLRWSGVRFDVVLAAVLLLVAALTYQLSRHWAFFRESRR
jgi:putative flippase GtrA